jgi:hypothetical protein
MLLVASLFTLSQVSPRGRKIDFIDTATRDLKPTKLCAFAHLAFYVSQNDSSSLGE